MRAIREEGDGIVQMLTQLMEEEGDFVFRSQAGRMALRPGPGARFVSIFDDGWREIAPGGDPSNLPIEDWSVVSIDTGPERARDFYVLRTRIDSFPVFIGIDLSIVRHTESVFLRTMLAIAILMTITFMALGDLASRGAQRKLDVVDRTLDRVAGGETDSRIPLQPTNDQIHRIAVQINGHLDRLSVLHAAVRNSAATVAHDRKATAEPSEDPRV